jgi:hypothetical protein
MVATTSQRRPARREAAAGDSPREAEVRPRRVLGPRRILQLSLVVAAAVALLLALTGVLNPGFAGPAADLSISVR